LSPSRDGRSILVGAFGSIACCIYGGDISKRVPVIKLGKSGNDEKDAYPSQIPRFVFIQFVGHCADYRADESERCDSCVEG